MTKPSDLPVWDENETNANQPNQARQDDGWLAPGGVPEKPPFQYFNWWQNNVFKWLKEINDKGILQYSNNVDYVADLAYAVGSDGNLYHCKINNGPSSSVVDPVGDVTGTWEVAFTQGQSDNLVIFTASGSYSKPAGLKFIDVVVIGGGGGGGGVDNTLSGPAAIGASGAGAGASIKLIAEATLLSTETVTIGAGGSGGATGNNSGVIGGTTSFGAHCQATGGGGGAGGAGGSAQALVLSGPGGVGSGGDINLSGAPAEKSVRLGATGIQTCSGVGGSSIFSGGAQSVTDSNGNQATSFGSGGSGASATSTNDFAGGDGADGIVIIKEFF